MPAGAHEVAGPVTNDGPSGAAEIREYELSNTTFRNGLPRLGVEHFGDKLRFDDVQARLRITRIAVGADFSGAGMIEALRAPRPLYSIANLWD